MASKSAARYQALASAGRFRLNRSQAAEETAAGNCGTGGSPAPWETLLRRSLIFHARVQPGVGGVHEQIEPDEEHRVKQGQTNNNGVIAVERTVH